MIDKVKNILTILLVIFIVIAIVYSVVSLVISAFEKPDLITSEEIYLHMIPSNLLTSYSTYYYLESCLDNLVEATKQEKYTELYKLYIGDYKEQYTKDEVIDKLKDFKSEDVELEKVYVIDNIYLLEIDLDGLTQYMLMNTDTAKQSSYQFAFIK